MAATIVLTQPIAEEIDAAARLPVETAGVLLATMVVIGDSEIRLLARRMCWIPESGYARRGEDHLAITSDGYVPFLADAETLGSVAIWVHTHPGLDSPPKPSSHDAEVDHQIADLFRLRAGTPYYGTLIFSPRPTGFAYSGYIQHASGPQEPINRCWQVGDRLRLTNSFLSSTQVVSEHFDRNVRAFGGAVQQTLSDLRVGIVGCGGIGSAVAEQLVRLWREKFSAD